MADLPGDPAQPAPDAAALKILVPAVGALLALAAALAAACFVRAYGVAFLGRPPIGRRRRRAGDRPLVAGRHGRPRPAVPARRRAAGSGHRCPGAGRARHGRGSPHRRRSAQPWLSIVPIAESRSSYNGLLVLLFIAVSASLAAVVIHRLASRAVRRAPAWDCGFPDPSPATQYTAASFAQPIRRVFGLQAVRRPRRGRHAAARRHARRPASPAAARSDLGRASTPRSPSPSTISPERLNVLQFLTIRVYLALVFAGPGRPAAGAGGMAVIGLLAIQGAQMLLVLAAGAALTGFVRKVKARLLRRRGPPILQPYRDLLRLLRKEVVLAHERLLAVPRRALSDLRRDLGRRRPGADLRHRPAVQLVGRPDRHHRAARQRPLLPRARRHGCRHQLRRHRLEPRGDDRLARRAGDDHDRLHPGADRRLDPALDRRRLHVVLRTSACGSRSAWR